MKRLSLMAATVVLLAACGEKPQGPTPSAAAPDEKPWQANKNPYVSKGWEPGDKARWENQLRSRAQTQNEYVKVN